MVRYLFDGGELVINATGDAQPGHPFTVWTDRSGGDNVTADMRAPDGVSVVDVETDADGEIPYLRGPDGLKGPLYRDTGTDTRSVWRSAEAERDTSTVVDDLNAAPRALPDGGQLGNFLAWVAPRQGEWADPPSGTGSGIDGAPSAWPQSFPPSLHKHALSDLLRTSDNAALASFIITLLNADTPGAARTALGAGVPVTGFPGFGTSDTTAARGDHGHNADALTFAPRPALGLTANTLQLAVEQAAQLGSGSGGTSESMEWQYTGGAYPTLPTTKPAGLKAVYSSGPTAPQTGPAWLFGSSATAKLFYTWAPWT